MKELKETELVVVNQEGIEEICNILFTHENNEKMYAVFEFAESKEISAAQYFPGQTEAEGTFSDIETDEEWEMLDELLEAYLDDLEKDDEDE